MSPAYHQPVAGTATAELKPTLRGFSHAACFFVSLPLGLILVLEAKTAKGIAAAIVFAVTVSTMFGASALYHCFNWAEGTKRWLRRIDHTGVYLLIAGTYTPFCLLVLDGTWRMVILAIVWTGVLAAILLRFVWLDAPKALSAALGIALGWVGVVMGPQLVDTIGLGGTALVLAGGLAYTAGALVYAFRWPDPYPAVFGFHEVFHVFVIAAVALQYTAVAFFVLPD